MGGTAIPSNAFVKVNDDGTLGDVVEQVVADRRDDPGGTRGERAVTGEADAR